jgi:hypothetical protein
MKIIVAVFLLLAFMPICHAVEPSSSSIIELKEKDSLVKEPTTRVELLEHVLILELQRKIQSVLQEEYFKPNSGGYRFEPFIVKDIQKRSRGGYKIKVEGKIDHGKKTDLVFIWFEHTIYRGFVVTKFIVSDEQHH